jgi:multidrug efflux system outer membrane protein
MWLRALLAVWISAVWLVGCDLAPEYGRPEIALPTKFKGDSIWQEAHPSDDRPHGDWWFSFGDHKLDELEPLVETSNQSLAAALAVYDQARASVARAQAALYPGLANRDHLSSDKQSAYRPLRGAGEPTYYGDNSLVVKASYEFDVWGRIRDTVAQSKAMAQASAADLESVRLNLQAELARDYLSLRGLDREIKLLRDTVVAYNQALELTQQRLAGKIASPLDVERAEVQLDNAKAQLAELAGPRAAFENAIATLIGQPASTFSIPPSVRAIRIPTFPPGIPSTLLERRPDIASAERQTAAANEAIGIARAAFYPRLTLNLAGGTQDTGLNLLSLQNSLWAVGPTLYVPIFDGGLRDADLTAAEAAYRETVARYRAVVLQAIQEVEDDLALLKSLKIEAGNTEAAAIAAQKASDLALTLYRNGATNYLDVVVAQTAALNEQRLALVLDTRRLQTSVALILAIGGNSSLQLAKQDHHFER